MCILLFSVCFHFNVSVVHMGSPPGSVRLLGTFWHKRRKAQGLRTSQPEVSTHFGGGQSQNRCFGQHWWRVPTAIDVRLCCCTKLMCHLPWRAIRRVNSTHQHVASKSHEVEEPLQGSCCIKWLNCRPPPLWFVYWETCCCIICSLQPVAQLLHGASKPTCRYTSQKRTVEFVF